MTEEVIDHVARAEMAKHNAVCTERYGNLWDAVKGIREDLQADRVAHATATAAAHTRSTTISNRMYAGLAAIAGACIVAVFVLAYDMLKRGHG